MKALQIQFLKIYIMATVHTVQYDSMILNKDYWEAEVLYSRIITRRDHYASQRPGGYHSTNSAN